MRANSITEIYKEFSANITHALQTRLTVVVCGPGRPESPNPDDPYRLREAVRQSLESDQVFFFEDLVTSEQGENAREFLEKTLQQTPRVDQIEILLLKGTTIDKDVHIVEGIGAIVELTQFVADSDVFKKIYAFVNECHRNDPSYFQQSVLVRLIKAGRLYWFKNESDLSSKVKEALNPNRISKSGILPP